MQGDVLEAVICVGSNQVRLPPGPARPDPTNCADVSRGEVRVVLPMLRHGLRLPQRLLLAPHPVPLAHPAPFPPSAVLPVRVVLPVPRPTAAIPNLRPRRRPPRSLATARAPRRRIAAESVLPMRHAAATAAAAAAAADAGRAGEGGRARRARVGRAGGAGFHVRTPHLCVAAATSPTAAHRQARRPLPVNVAVLAIVATVGGGSRHGHGPRWACKGRVAHDSGRGGRRAPGAGLWGVVIRVQTGPRCAGPVPSTLRATARAVSGKELEWQGSGGARRVEWQG